MFMNKYRCISANSSAPARLVRFIGMMLLSCSIAPALAQTSAVSTTAAGTGTAADPVVYGQIYHLQNGYTLGPGGYLDVRASGCNGNTLCVSTATVDNRDQGSGSWMILPADGSMKTKGDQVSPGDFVYLINQYPVKNISGPIDGTPGGYLDTRGQGCQSNRMCVSTSLAKNTSVNSSVWEIITGDVFLTGQDIHLMNRYVDGASHTYLDIRNNNCNSNLRCVSTSTGWNRDSGSGSWRFFAVVPSP
ncbi:hypothetical protein RBA41_12895 [Massilia sp. CCM 9210]|uniref:hypothetical protein n=1 Tax=Massilia scottii TaxID=3057166 RepID=UPI002796DF67|nr:hypothetical protein [Massilia sp. CCM 9210]MDQ1814205.1 hypothetical protein [Massilia sp. CCM 9210]